MNEEIRSVVEKQYVSAAQLLDDSFRLGVKILESGFRPHFIVGIWRNEEMLLNRPDDNQEDQKDELRLTQTHLEQIASNRAFRPLADTGRTCGKRH